MPNMDRNIIISFWLALCGAAVTRAVLIETPVNAAHFITQSVEFNCTAEPSNDTHPYDWQYNPMNHVPVRIVSDCQVNPAFADKYVTEVTADGGCRLILPNLLYDAAGTYTCQHGFDQGSADLIMLNNNSSCTFSPSDLMEGENITIFCYLNYNGTIAPLLDFRSETGNIINNATYQRFPTQVNIQVILPVYPPTTRAITGNTYFPPNSGIPFFFTWTLPTLYIQYPVKNIATTVEGEFCEDLYYANSTVLRCSAEGFPPPVITWTDLDSGTVYQTDTITLSNEGLNQFLCTATNDIRDVYYDVYDNVTVTLQPGLPDTCTPETQPPATTEETTSAPTTTTPEPTTTPMPITACGSVLHVGQANASNGFSIMCYIMRNDTDYLSTPCRQLIQNLPPSIGNADDLLAKGGDFGCGMQTSVNWGSAPGQSCISQYQTGISLSGCGICPVLHVCIKLP